MTQEMIKKSGLDPLFLCFSTCNLKSQNQVEN